MPVDSLIDALRCQRSDGSMPEVAINSDAELICIVASGEIETHPARMAPWPNVIAFRAPDCSQHFGECAGCGDVTSIFSYQCKNNAGESCVRIYEECHNEDCIESMPDEYGDES